MACGGLQREEQRTRDLADAWRVDSDGSFGMKLPYKHGILLRGR